MVVGASPVRPLLPATPGQRGRPVLWAVLGSLIALLPTRSPAADEPVEFDPAFLRGGAQVDVSRFSKGNPVLPGDYPVDILVNSLWSGHASVRFVAQSNSDIAQPCIDHALIARIGLDLAKLTETARKQLAAAGATGCVDLPRLIEDATVSFDLSQLRLDISAPQAVMQNKPRGYVSPEFWDSGVPAATLGYNLNAYRSKQSWVTLDDAHLDLSLGLNWGSWHLRQRSTADTGTEQPSTYHNLATYLTHDLPALRSDLTVGDSFTDGAVFNSLGYRGVSLATNDQMLPDSQLQYAPVVRGIARTNARVVISQNGNTILETTVSPGPFQISDLYATGYGGDLKVTVYEADGSQNSFTIPYAALVQMLRPGQWRYTAVFGKSLQSSVSGDHFFQGTLQHGFNSLLTGYAGAQISKRYSAGLMGVALNTRYGAVSLDVTEASAGIGRNYSEGKSLKFSYSKLFSDTKTNLTVSSFRYSSSGYYAFEEQQSVNAAANTDDISVSRPRSQWLINVNQSLPGQRGNFYLTASVRDYWYTAGTSTEYQAGYTNHIRLWGTSLSYSISAARQYNILTGKPDRQLQANFSLPLGRTSHAPLLTTSFTRDTTGGERTQGTREMLTGTAGETSQVSYSVSASETNGGNSYTGSGEYQSRYASIAASLGMGSNFSQQSFGVTGGVVAHPGGITFANQMTDTIGIVEAIGAEGARVTNSGGTVIDKSGYAVLPFLMPYRMNAVNIDPEGAISADVEFKSTSESVAPRLNSVVMIRFQTVSGRAILISAHLPDGTMVPFGASVYDAQGSEVGLSGQDGGIYLRGIADTGVLKARWGEAPDESCVFEYRLPPQQKSDPPIIRLDATCKAAPPDPRGAATPQAPQNP